MAYNFTTVISLQNESIYECGCNCGILITWIKSRFLAIAIDGSTLGWINMLCCVAKYLIRIASVDSAQSQYETGTRREGCLFRTMSFPEEIALKSQRIFLLGRNVRIEKIMTKFFEIVGTLLKNTGQIENFESYVLFDWWHNYALNRHIDE